MADNQKSVSVVIGGNKRRELLTLVKKVVVILLALLLVLVILFYIPATKPLINRFLGIATPQTSGPCSGNAELIKRYNAAMKEQGVISISDMVKEARAQKDYTTDTTCVYISMLGYYGENVPQKSLDEYNRLKQLKAEGKLPAVAINDGINLTDLHKTLKETADQKSDNPYVQG